MGREVDDRRRAERRPHRLLGRVVAEEEEGPGQGRGHVGGLDPGTGQRGSGGAAPRDGVGQAHRLGVTDDQSALPGRRVAGGPAGGPGAGYGAGSGGQVRRAQGDEARAGQVAHDVPGSQRHAVERERVERHTGGGSGRDDDDLTRRSQRVRHGPEEDVGQPLAVGVDRSAVGTRGSEAARRPGKGPHVAHVVRGHDPAGADHPDEHLTRRDEELEQHGVGGQSSGDLVDGHGRRGGVHRPPVVRVDRREALLGRPHGLLRGVALGTQPLQRLGSGGGSDRE